ncbi:SusC/RagA family protein [Elizabethkingia miricola]|uniref:SusC/RagA family TonB-linked outer membrane protein n=1 Tax=Elizabethkingia miricola TaxID=172045 RepID=A0AAP1BWB0_ELIMR|nr:MULTISPECIES: SusC/RagA family TonB-linked outer membrane protein [Elizabethkingia]KUY19642.1 SusC/RagA family TonB-linked outer membrane protein [Elizabethkingia miricola]MCL1651271.1 SusC/RagA family TonB-linked outer membrane protein [Elizabethkingia miricola]MCL1678394.1 SusC/RagA family TonB-linked outer membrane protein [Elizabethkingia miricola]OPC14373.1 SusC/RagA family protein [Elizabethkingia miricola]OPC32633.1 SusC/RagA family protein [Elizabethkingia miricola]
MKKLTNSVLVVVLSSSFVFVNAQKKQDTTKTKDIEGVVVTALGIKREKKSLGYSSQEVKAGVLSDGTTNTGNVASQLAGKVAGLQVNTTSNFGGSTNLVIRGYKSLNGGQALIVVDGVPINNGTAGSTGRQTTYDYGNFLSDMNQEDIESINVLKGAAASSLYGERALNGVIVITTKKGKSQDDRWGITLSTEVNVGTVDKKTFPTYQSRYGAGYGPFGDYDANPYFNTGPDGKPMVSFGDDASWGAEFNPNLLVWQWSAFDPTSPNYGKATPWVAAKHGPIDFFNTAMTYTNSVTLEKGNNDANFFLNYTNYQTEGIVPNSSIKKNTLSTKANYKFNDHLTATVYATLNNQGTIGRTPTGYNSGQMSAFRQWWQTNVDLYEQRDTYFRTKRNISWNSGDPSKAPLYWSNPYYQAYENYQSDDRTRFFGWASLDFKVNKNITITGRMSHDTYNMLIENRLRQGTTSETFGASNATTSSGYEKTNMVRSETNFDLIGQYKYNLSDDFILSGVVGGNVRRNYFTSTYNSTEPGSKKDPSVGAFVGLTIPGLFSLANSAGAVRPAVEVEQKSVTAGAFAQASLSYKDTYFVDGSYRVDKNSNLLKGNNVYGYGSISGAIILSQLIKQDWLSFAKLRGNYAVVGGSTGNYNLFNTYTSRPLLNDTPLYNATTTAKERELKPEKSKEIEVGLEANFFKNRLGFDIAAYSTRTFNQIIPTSISSSTGYFNSYINAGQINNKGIEVTLNATPFKTKDFSWDISINWAKNQNKVVDLIDGVDNIQLVGRIYGALGATIQAYKGRPFGELFGTTWALDPNGNRIVDEIVSNGQTFYRYRKTDAVNNPIGNITPDWTGGIRNQFRYKDLSFGFLIDIQKGGQVYSYDMAAGLETGLYAETAVGDYRTANRPVSGVLETRDNNGKVVYKPVSGVQYVDGSSTTAPDGNTLNPDSAFLYDASYVKLREANITYRLPKSLIKNTFINEASIALVGRNLWIIHKNLPYADPESGLSGGLNSRGISHASLPTTREIGVNITFKF